MQVSLDVMHSKDGIYIIHTPTEFGFVEVEKGVCHQLTLKGVRDGILTPGGWNTHYIRAIYGPFKKV